MNYIPELREALVKAAERQQENVDVTPAPTRRTARFSFRPIASLSGLVLILAPLAAIAVAVIAFTQVRHAAPLDPTGSAGSSKAAALANDRASRVAAHQLLERLKLPAGAVKSGLVAGIPADLWTPSELIATPHRVDVYGVWRLPQSVRQVIRFIENHGPPGLQLGLGSQSGGGSAGQSQGRGSRFVVDTATEEFNSSGTVATVIWRELALQADALKGGGTALRADAQAGWLNPRPAAERIPSAIDRVQVTAYGPSGRYKQGQRTISLASAARIKALIGRLNGLPIAQGRVGRCPGDTGLRVSFEFYSPARAQAAAVAVYNPFCSRVQLVLRGQRQPDLQVGLPDGFEKEAALVRGILSVAPRLR